MHRIPSAPLLALVLVVAMTTPGRADESVDALRAKADAQAEFDLGSKYLEGLNRKEGRGVPQNLDEGARLIRKAADQGLADADYLLGDLYSSGTGVLHDEVEGAKRYRKALESYRKAAGQGNAKGQFHLGYMYFHGVGVPRNEVEGEKWLLMSANQGDAKAQGELGSIYLDGGSDQPKNRVKGAMWLRKAADQGDSNAQFFLGKLYATPLGNSIETATTPLGAPFDLDEAAKWIRKAANQGHLWAQEDLSRRYLRGWGVRQDLVEAYKWCLLIGESEGILDELRLPLTLEQRAEAERWAREFKPVKETAPARK